MTWDDVATRFRELARDESRAGVIAAVDLGLVRLLPQQDLYLERLLAPLLRKPGAGLDREDAQDPDGGPDSDPATRPQITAVSLGLAYERAELRGIPGGWAEQADRDAWNEYARAYGRLNDAVTRVAAKLAAEFGGVCEGATLEGRAGQVKHVSDYYPHCVSHRAVAAAAGLGWIGRHGLLVTPEFGPALRLATVFLPGKVESPPRDLCGCRASGVRSAATDSGGAGSEESASCRACLDACPILERATRQEDPDLYREGCLRRIRSLGLEADVCGICVRACLERPG